MIAKIRFKTGSGPSFGTSKKENKESAEINMNMFVYMVLFKSFYVF